MTQNGEMQLFTLGSTVRWNTQWLVCLLFHLSVGAFDLRAEPQNNDVRAMHVEAVALIGAGKFLEAETKLKECLDSYSAAYGDESTQVAETLYSLAEAYTELGRLSDAERDAERSLEIWRKLVGENHGGTANALYYLGLLRDKQGRRGEAIALLNTSLAIRESIHGKDHLEVAQSLTTLSGFHRANGNLQQARDLAERSLKIKETLLGELHPDVGNSLNALAMAVEELGEFDVAERLYKRSLELVERRHGPSHPNVGLSLNNLAMMYGAVGRTQEAEAHFLRAIEVLEAAYGKEHAHTGTVLNNLASFYSAQARYTEAVPLFMRSATITEKSLGREHPSYAVAMQNVALVFQKLNRPVEAEQLQRQALAIFDRTLDAQHPDIATALDNLSGSLTAQGRHEEALAIAKNSLDIRVKALGSVHQSVGIGYNNIGDIYASMGHFEDAEDYYRRGLDTMTQLFGAEHQSVATALSNLAGVRFSRGDWRVSSEYSRRSIAVTELNAARVTQDAAPGTVLSDFEYLVLIKAVHQLESVSDASLANEMFVAAQGAQRNLAAQSLAKMAARNNSSTLRALARERQDLHSERRRTSNLLVSRTAEAPDKRNEEQERSLKSQLSALDRQLASTDERLRTEFPDYFDLASPKPITVEEVQKYLKENEALVLLLDTYELKPLPNEVFVWIITKSHTKWYGVPFDSKGLFGHIPQLRCGLDVAAWRFEHFQCAKHLATTPSDAELRTGKLPPFDAVKAHEVYKTVLGKAEDLIAGKDLLVIPSDSLTYLPLQVLVTRPPESGKPIAWIIREHALTILPSAASLRSLRARERVQDKAHKPYLAFANPVLDGRSTDPNRELLADAAKRRQHCAQTRDEDLLATFSAEQTDLSDASTVLGGTVEPNGLRQMTPVPQTATLACRLATTVGASDEDVFLADRATETALKRLNDSGQLASYSVLNFVTHGLIAGALGPTAEPGLVLTPPQSGTELDDGYLSASEVASLNLDADWVILSACNTAAPDFGRNDALSGLAKAFFYAGARALLVSHWSVREKAAVEILSGSLAHKNVGRAEALRRSMLALADSPDPSTAHPAYWAPFVVIGEGAGSVQ
ncbi:CHAT domain-containing tetratricopeptide repeat protein [uncultured Hyphomicrobium sp.]|uniref:CHAT domain-containing protein n=1 Tax=uncultured Hyphomicrobium sp. TaxID=194373 RepID=UPI0025EE9CA9|nr:CHAT domain-containing tetratricopeptide repeat protein [uncultured Hyphomicrobium sp.]